MAGEGAEKNILYNHRQRVYPPVHKDNPMQDLADKGINRLYALHLDDYRHPHAGIGGSFQDLVRVM